MLPFIAEAYLASWSRSFEDLLLALVDVDDNPLICFLDSANLKINFNLKESKIFLEVGTFII